MNKPIRATVMQAIDGGRLSEVSEVEDGWRFTFENEIAVESYAGWRVFQPGNPSKTLIGSRDLDGLESPLKEMLEVVGEYSLTTLYFDLLRDGLGLVLEETSGDNLFRLEILKTSARKENWRIFGEDFVDSDKEELIVNMSRSADDT